MNCWEDLFIQRYKSKNILIKEQQVSEQNRSPNHGTNRTRHEITQRKKPRQGNQEHAEHRHQPQGETTTEVRHTSG